MIKYLIFLLLSLVLGQDQNAQSPCPDIFNYKSDGLITYGVIRLWPFGKVSSVNLLVNFTIPTKIAIENAGRIEALGSKQQILRLVNRGVPITYRVDFPVTSTLPRLVSLTANDHIICYGDDYRKIASDWLNEFSTPFTLRHRLVLQQGFTAGFFNQYEIEANNPALDSPGAAPVINDNSPPVYNSGIVQQSDTDPVTQAPVTQATLPQQLIEEPVPPPLQATSVQSLLEKYTQSPPTFPQSFNDSIIPGECGIRTRGEWPWVVAIYKNAGAGLNFICAGTLVSERHVITAAHCAYQRSKTTPPYNLFVKVGAYYLQDWDKSSEIKPVWSTHPHQLYNSTTLAHDIMVIVMNPVTFSQYVKPVCLWDADPDLNMIAGASGVVAGWGANKKAGDDIYTELHVTRMPIVSLEMCRSSSPEFIHLTSYFTICAGNRNGDGPCLGDAGAGLFLLNNGLWHLRGIVSLALQKKPEHTCDLTKYTVFTDSAQYLNWINTIISNT